MHQLDQISHNKNHSAFSQFNSFHLKDFNLVQSTLLSSVPADEWEECLMLDQHIPNKRKGCTPPKQPDLVNFNSNEP